MKEADAAWTRWFAQQEVEPVRLTYEALSAEPQVTLGSVLSSLGLDPGIARSVGPKTAKLADSESFQWVVQFKTENAQ